MDILNDYFESLVFQYVGEKQSQAIYAAAVNGLLGGDKMRCVIAFVPVHLGIQQRARLQDLQWVNLQTRCCPTDTYKIPLQKWRAPTQGIPDMMFTVVSRDQQYSTYKIDRSTDNKTINFPFNILMVNTSKKKTMYQYPNTMNLHWAIDQFNTVFEYAGEQYAYVPQENVNVSSQNMRNELPQNNNIEWI